MQQGQIFPFLNLSSTTHQGIKCKGIDLLLSFIFLLGRESFKFLQPPFFAVNSVLWLKSTRISSAESLPLAAQKLGTYIGHQFPEMLLGKTLFLYSSSSSSSSSNPLYSLVLFEKGA